MPCSCARWGRGSVPGCPCGQTRRQIRGGRWDRARSAGAVLGQLCDSEGHGTSALPFPSPESLPSTALAPPARRDCVCVPVLPLSYPCPFPCTCLVPVHVLSLSLLLSLSISYPYPVPSLFLSLSLPLFCPCPIPVLSCPVPIPSLSLHPSQLGDSARSRRLNGLDPLHSRDSSPKPPSHTHGMSARPQAL